MQGQKHKHRRAILPRDALLAAMTDLEAFSATVEKIYDAAIDPEKWTIALKHMREYVDGSSIALHYASADPEKFGGAILHNVGFTHEFLQDSARYERGWAAQIDLLNWPVGDVKHLPDLVPEKAYLKGAFYRNVIKPHGELDYIGMVSLKEAGTIVPFTVSTTVQRGHFSPANVAAVKQLAPHICRAVKISTAFELQSFNSSLMESSLNGLKSGVYILSHDRRVIFMNLTAEKQIKAGRAITIRQGFLVPTNREAAEHFARQCETHNTFLETAKTSDISIALPDPRGGLVATLLPMGHGNRQFVAGDDSRSAYTVFIQDPAATMAHPGDGFKNHYGLTTAELRVVMVMLEADGVAGVADVLGLSPATIKTHLRNIFAKTGVTSQLKLMQLVMQSMAPTA
jgi:DNA-binding CsgD family transcriptional regulator